MSRFWKKNQALDRVIYEKVDYHRVDIKHVKPGKKFEIQVANDEFFIKDDTKAVAAIQTYFIIAFLFLLACFIGYFNTDKDKFDNSLFFIPTPFVALALFHLIVYLKVPKKEIILDRLNGKITYPRLFWHKEHRTVPFDLLKVHIMLTSSGDMIPNGVELRIMDREYRGSWTLETDEAREYWSFMVWYMDKNRPLPPGSAFDAYRQRDFERRKAEGFPKPLYPSYFETPEATPAQQRERKKIGKW